MNYEGKVYAKINGRYIECTETIEDLENRIKELESNLSPSDVIEELTDIRKELMIAEFGGDWLAMKFQVNRIDTILYKSYLEHKHD